MKQTKEEILAAEQAVENRKDSRRVGFDKMKERDNGYAILRDYNGRKVIMEWHIPKERREPNLAYSGVDEGYFTLKAGSLIYAFDSEEFRKALRWV